jgi:hypothetical protein
MSDMLASFRRCYGMGFANLVPRKPETGGRISANTPRKRRAFWMRSAPVGDARLAGFLLSELGTSLDL